MSCVGVESVPIVCNKSNDHVYSTLLIGKTLRKVDSRGDIPVERPRPEMVYPLVIRSGIGFKGEIACCGR
jgi:hypothetical protein